jgi:hypothetical protein
MSPVTVQHILVAQFDDYQAHHALPGYVVRAARRMIQCRTEALGGHVQSCPKGHVHHVWYNSCKHRSCPQCAALQMEQWLDRQCARLLDCDHYHTVFTVPSELNRVWAFNRRRFADLLFGSVRDTLAKLLDDPKYLGGRPGMLMALHTWGSNLAEHPHIHCLITGGGLTKGGQWKKMVKDSLLPRKVAMIIFRAKFLDALRQAAVAGKLSMPEGLRLNQFKGLLNKLGRAVWNVKILDRYGSGKGVLKYLARYVRGGPISNRRLISFQDGQVAFRCKNYKEEGTGRPQAAVTRLPQDEFLRRLLQHVPLPGCQTVRSYGLYANTKKAALALARQRLGLPEASMPDPVTWEEFLARLGCLPPRTCPVCGAALVRHSEFARGKHPPALENVKRTMA